MTAIIAFLTAHGALILGLGFALVNLFVAIFAKNAKATGALAWIRKILELVSALQPRDSEGTVKVPGTKPGPRVTPLMKDK